MFYVVAALFTLLLGYWIAKTIKESLSPLSKVPEPPRYPFLHHFPYFYNNKDQIKVITDWCEQFKEYGMFKIKLLIAPRENTVVLLKPEYAKTVLSKPDIFKRSEFLEDFFPLVGKALLNSTGAEHQQQRKFFAKAFTMANMKHFIPVFNKHANVLTEVWEELVRGEEKGKNITVLNYFANMTLDAIGELSFGYHFNCQRTENKFGSLLKRHLAGLSYMSRRLLLKTFPFLWYMPFGPGKFLKDSNKEMDKLLDEVIAARMKKIAEGTLTETEKNDLLNIMIMEKESTGEFTDQLIKDSSFTFLFAGHETTATSLPGVLLYLTLHPDLQEKVRDEINEHIAVVEDMNLDDLEKLTYTGAFIKESLRLFQPIPQNGRVSMKDYKFGDYLIPKDTMLFLPNSHYHSQEENFENGKEFIPERFFEDGLKHGTPLTFGYGPYSCIGKHFALIEMKVTIVQLLKKFKFSIDPGCEKFQRQQLITLKTFPDLQFRVKLL